MPDRLQGRSRQPTGSRACARPSSWTRSADRARSSRQRGPCARVYDLPCVKIRAVQHWDLRSIDAPRGTRDPYVVHQDEGARAVLVSIEPGQALGEHQVKENAWVVVVDGLVQVTAGSDRVELGPGGLLRFEP